MSTHQFTLHHASFIVKDTAAALAFYNGILGMPLIERPPLDFKGAWLGMGNQQLHLLELDNPDPITGRPTHGGRDRHVALHVDNIAALRADLDAANHPYTLSISGRKALFCRDLDGNTLEFIERP